MQFHPLAYIVKLNIEMTMSELISKVARAQNNPHGAVLPSTTTGDRSGQRSRVIRTDDKALTQSKINAFNGPISEEMEMGILKNSGPPNHSTDVEAETFDSSDGDDESIKRTGFVVRKKQEFHVRVESASANGPRDEVVDSSRSKAGERHRPSGAVQQTQWESC